MREERPKKKQFPTCRAISADCSCIHCAPRVFFFSSSTTRSREHTRTHGTEATSPQPSSVSRLLLVPTHPHSQGRPLDSPSSPVQPDQSPSPPPQGAASRRSELESGPSSPHHQSGKYTRAIKILRSFFRCSLSRKFLCWAKTVFFSFDPPKGRSFRVLPHTHTITQIPGSRSFCLVRPRGGRNGMRDARQLACCAFRPCSRKRPSFFRSVPRLPLPGTL